MHDGRDDDLLVVDPVEESERKPPYQPTSCLVADSPARFWVLSDVRRRPLDLVEELQTQRGNPSLLASLVPSYSPGSRHAIRFTAARGNHERPDTGPFDARLAAADFRVFRPHRLGGG